VLSTNWKKFKKLGGINPHGNLVGGGGGGGGSSGIGGGCIRRIIQSINIE
jgi:hypothetical protein